MSTIFASLLIGGVGYVYFSFGKKMARPMFIAAGIGLMVFPYFVDSIPLTVLIGCGLAGLPFVVKI